MTEIRDGLAAAGRRTLLLTFAPLLAALVASAIWAAAGGPVLPMVILAAAIGLSALIARVQIGEHLIRPLAAAEARLAAAVEALPDGLVIFDREDRIAFYNSRYPEHLSDSLRSVLARGKRFADWIREGLAIGPIYHAEMGEDFPERRLAMRELDRSEHVHRLVDGRWLRIRENRTAGGERVLLTTDITEARRREEERALLALAVEQVGDPVEITGADDCFTYVNRAFETATGWSSAEALGRKPQDLLSSGTHPASFFDTIASELKAGRSWHGTIVNRHRDGRNISQETTISPLRGADGQATHFVAVKRDVTAAEAQARALAESEAQFRGIVDGMPVPVVIAEPATGRPLLLNAAARRSFGLGPEETPGSISALWEEPAEFAALAAAVAEGREVDQRETRLRLFDGRWATALVSVAPITYRGEPALLASTVDISALRAAERALRESEARLAAFMEFAPIAAHLRDRDGRYLMINRQMEGILGKKAAEAIGRRPTDLASAERVGNSDRHFQTVLETGRPHVSEQHLLYLEGPYRWTMVIRFPILDAEGGVLAVGTFGVDITERKLAEAALKASEARLATIIDANPAALNISRIENGHPLFVNRPYLELFGLTESELATMDRRRLYADPEDRRHIFAEISAGRAVNGYELTLRRADGTEFPASITSRPVDFQGEAALVTSTIDLTALRSAEAEIRRQRETLHQSEKMSALGSLLAGVAHELNNPLSVVVGYSAMLRELTDDPALLARFEKISAAADRCARIVRTFLAMARARPPRREAVDAADVVKAAVELSAYATRTADVAVETDLAPGLPPLSADADQLHQVITNLIVNAQQALLGQDGPRRIRIATRLHAGMVEIEVADNGPGMTDAVRARAFEPFFTTKPQGVGTGVGLSVCRGIVEGHGGRIELDTAPGEGARFRIVLPPGDPAKSAAEEAAPPAKARGRVLVVDDEPDIAALLSESFAGAGLEVDTAGSGRQALEKLKGARYEALVTDLRMADLDGPALIAALAGQHPELTGRIIAITGDALGSARPLPEDVPVFEKPLDLPALAAELIRRMAKGATA